MRDNSLRSQQAIYIFLSLGLVTVCTIIVNLLYCFVLGGTEAHSTTGTVIASLQSLLSIVEIGLTVWSAVSFMRWMRRAYFNLAALGVGVEYDDRWAVSAWIIPVVSLYRPYTIMREIWQRTQRVAYGLVTPHGLLRLWWLLFLLHSLTGAVTGQVANQVSTVEGLRAELMLLAVVAVLDIAAIAVTIQVIRRVSDFEQQLQLQAQVAGIGNPASQPLDAGATDQELYA